MFNKVAKMQVTVDSQAAFSLHTLLARAAILIVAVIALLCASNAMAEFANGTGIARIPNPTSSDEGWGIALQSDSKVVVAGRCFENGVRACVARLNADGTLDTTFNPAGSVPGKRVIDGLTLMSTSFLPRVKVLVDADDKIVVASTCTLSNREYMCVARLTPNGSFDDAFDGPDAANPGNGRFLLTLTSNNNFLNDAALQRIDGRIVLVGQCLNFYHCIARLKTSDGSFDDDTSSGALGLAGPAAIDRPSGDPSANGRFAYRFPSPNSSSGIGTAIAVETTNEGKILIAGGCGSLRSILCLTKFNRDGTFDDDFRGDSLPVGQGGRLIIVAANQSGQQVEVNAKDIKMQADGRFLLQCQYIAIGVNSQCMYRINSGGTIATSFSSGLPFPSVPGRVVYNVFGTAVKFAITPPTGSYANRIVTLGECDGVGGFSNAPFCVTAILNGTGATDGVIDTTLTGPNGDQAGTFNFPVRFSNPSNNTKEVVANGNGEFFVVGECDNQMCVYKFRPDGALDTSPCAADVDGDGNVSAASDGTRLIRWMRDAATSPNIPAGLGYDIDGDGVINASRDGLLLVRRMLGFSESAVLSGITFSSSARRSQWADIESYMRKRCRVPRTSGTGGPLPPG
jgi:uncharacterized delta-60 repeat protein